MMGEDAPAVGYDHLHVDNPEPQLNSPSVKISKGALGDRYVIALVGVPASGKTYIARRLCQYLQFFHGATTEVFNLGNYRREEVGAQSKSDFFDPNNAEGVATRDRLAKKAMDDLKAWLADSGGQGRVAIYDAANSTRARRKWIVDQLSPEVESRRKIIMVESVVKDPELVASNVREIKTTMPDYEGMDAADAEKDFLQRIEHYRSTYEPLDDELDHDLTWVKLVDGGRHISMNNIAGFLPGRIVQFLMNLHTVQRPIYLSRHGQSKYNELGKIGGDSSLSPQGEEYALELAKFAHTEILGLNEDGSFPAEGRKASHARLFTSSLQRTIRTARHIVHEECDDGWITMRPRVCPALDEIYAGVFDGMTYEEIKEQAPAEFAKRKADKLGYRYPRGESYLDVIQRLDQIVLELEKQKDPVLVVGHQGILRILFSYFCGSTREQAPFVSIPLNHVIKLVPRTYSCEVTRINLMQNMTTNDEPPSH